MTLDRDEELTAFKRVNLTVIAADHGYEIVKRKSTRHSILMQKHGDKIIVSKNGDHYVYCSTGDPSSNGTAIDFVQRVVSPGCSLGEVRKTLRNYLDGGYYASVQRRTSGNFAQEIKPSELDLLGVAARYSQLDPVDEPNKFLTEVRGIPHDVLMSDRLRGRVRCCPRRGSIAFPHLGSPTDDPHNKDRCLTGYEIKHTGLSMFSKGGRKGLFMSAGFPGDKRLVVGEAGLDSISYLVARGDDGTRVCSTAGKFNPHQPVLLRSAIQHLGEGEIVAAFDRDAAGDEMTERLAEIAASHSHDSLVFTDDRPTAQGADWNQIVMEEAARQGRNIAASTSNRLSIGR